MARTPDEIMSDFEAAALGLADVDIHDVLWEIIEDVLHSVKLTQESFDAAVKANEDIFLGDPGELPNFYVTLRDYVVNHYGDS